MATDTVMPTRPETRESRRAWARENAAKARDLLREVARLVDGDLETVRHNTTTAIVAVDDVLDALQKAVDEDLRQWALDHNELGKDPE
jgi:hypothetical protein